MFLAKIDVIRLQNDDFLMKWPSPEPLIGVLRPGGEGLQGEAVPTPGNVYT